MINRSTLTEVIYCCSLFQEGESKNEERKSKDEEPLSREKFDEMQEKVSRSPTIPSKQYAVMSIV